VWCIRRGNDAATFKLVRVQAPYADDDLPPINCGMSQTLGAAPCHLAPPAGPRPQRLISRGGAPLSSPISHPISLISSFAHPSSLSLALTAHLISSAHRSPLTAGTYECEFSWLEKAEGPYDVDVYQGEAADAARRVGGGTLRNIASTLNCEDLTMVNWLVRPPPARPPRGGGGGG
jgi:hypothetical protein